MTLDKLAAFFQTDLSYILKGGSWLGISKLIGGSSSFLLFVSFANLLPKTTYGTYQYVLSITELLSLTTLPGMETALTQAAAQSKEAVFYPMTYLRIRRGFIGSLLSLFVAIYYYFDGRNTLSLSFVTAALFIPFMRSLTLWQALLVGRKDFQHHALYQALSKILFVSCVIATLLLTKNIVLLIAITFFVTTILRVFFTLVIHFFRPLSTESSASYVSYGKHLTLIYFLGSVSLYADKILLWYFLGPVALATYAVALAPITEARAWFKLLPTLALPKFASTEQQLLKKNLPAKLVRLAVPILGLIILYITAAPVLYRLFLSQYIDSTIYSQALSVVFLALPSRLLESAMFAHSQKKALYVATSLTSFSKIVLLLVLLPVLGLWGATIATIVPPFVNFVVLIYFFNKM